VSKEQTHQNICESLGSSTNLDKLAKIRQNQGVSAEYSLLQRNHHITFRTLVVFLLHTNVLLLIWLWSWSAGAGCFARIRAQFKI